MHDTTRSCSRHDLLVCGTCPILRWTMDESCHTWASGLCVTWLIYGPTSGLCVTWLIHSTHGHQYYVWHDSSMSPPRMTRDMTHPCHTWASVHHTESTHEYVLSQISMHHVPHINAPRPTYQGVMSHILTSHVTHGQSTTHKPHTNAFYLKYQCVRSPRVNQYLNVNFTFMNRCCNVTSANHQVPYIHQIYVYLSFMWDMARMRVCLCVCVCVCERETCQTYQCVNTTHKSCMSRICVSVVPVTHEWENDA